MTQESPEEPINLDPFFQIIKIDQLKREAEANPDGILTLTAESLAKILRTLILGKKEILLSLHGLRLLLRICAGRNIEKDLPFGEEPMDMDPKTFIRIVCGAFGKREGLNKEGLTLADVGIYPTGAEFLGLIREIELACS